MGVVLGLTRVMVSEWAFVVSGERKDGEDNISSLRVTALV